MERPTPLPAPPTAPERRVALIDRGDVHDRPDARAREVPLPVGPGPDEAPDVVGGSDAGAAARPAGLRDVWRAARARRRALRAEVRRFTARRRRRRLAWAAGAASVVALALATLGAAYSPLFAVEHVRVVGTQGLDAAAVEQALGAQVGTPLPLVDASAVKAALVAFPLVESFSLEARPPHELVVRVVERTPVGVVQGAAGYTLVDAAGVALATTPDPPAGQPILTVAGGAGGEVFAAAGLVVRALPADVRAQVTAVSATSVDDVAFTLGASGAQVVWGSADDSALKAAALETTIRVRPLGTVSVYDVSSPSAVVVR